MTEAMCYKLVKCRSFKLNVYSAFCNGLVLCRDILSLPHYLNNRLQDSTVTTELFFLR